jgi:hypothetical protein
VSAEGIFDATCPNIDAARQTKPDPVVRLDEQLLDSDDHAFRRLAPIAVPARHISHSRQERVDAQLGGTVPVRDAGA